ncbi:Protein-L-isoaspartate O-methyltransferase [Corynebacterium hansenii]|nr:Protein-L-isoaspartate O-methyltransferase [Corynebacterium hansenii]
MAGDGGAGASRERIREAMGRMRRTEFLPGDVKRLARMDSALPIGFGQTNSQPSTVAAMMELLDVPEGARVLDVGSGSGWSTAILADLVGPGGEVHGVELVPELVERGRRNVAAFDVPWAVIHPAEPGVLGLPGLAPFDRILVSAMAETLPEELIAQLGPGGIMVAPADGQMHRVRRGVADPADGVPRDDAPVITSHGAYVFVPLR